MYTSGGSGRESQIQELLNTRPECTARNAERSIFDFGLNVKRGFRSDLIVIRVTLPSAFPSVAPQVRILTQGVTHSWIDSGGNVTGCTSLYTWNSYSRLATVVTEILNQFVSHPPQVSGPTTGPPPPPMYTTTNSNRAVPSIPSPRSSQQQQQQQQQHQRRPSSMQKPRSNSDDDADGILIPPTPDSFPELKEMPFEQLEKLRDDEKAFQEFFNNLPMPTMTVEMRDQIIQSNEKQAKSNLEYKDKIEDLQNSILQLQAEAMTHWTNFKQLEEKQNAAMRQFDPLRLLTKLESSCNELDDESEIVAGEFLREEISLSDFVKRQMELRKLYHLRKAKAERFRQQLNKA